MKIKKIMKFINNYTKLVIILKIVIDIILIIVLIGIFIKFIL
jgi:hypothetical protein